jgi:hypothetical protein
LLIGVPTVESLEVIAASSRSNDQPQHFVNVEGIDGHVMTKWWLVTTGVVTEMNRGPINLIMKQYAHSGKGH